MCVRGCRPGACDATHTLPVVEIQPVNVRPSWWIARGSPKYDHAPAPSSLAIGGDGTGLDLTNVIFKCDDA